MNKDNPSDRESPSRAEATRQALLEAATRMFANDHFDSVSNRPLAEAANVNQALIGYHFGGKEGLYLAVMERVASELGERLGAMTEGVGAEIDALLGKADEVDQASIRAHCSDAIASLLGTHVRLLMEPQYEDFAKLIIREQMAPTQAFEILWQGIMQNFLGLITRLVALSRGRRNAAEEDRLLALTLIGQTLVFRFARAAVDRHMHWPTEPGADEVDAVEAAIRANVKLLTGGSL